MAETGPEKSVLKSSPLLSSPPACPCLRRIPLDVPLDTEGGGLADQKCASTISQHLWLARSRFVLSRAFCLHPRVASIEEKGATSGECRRPLNRPGLYEQVLVEASHFMWAFSQEAFVLCCSAASVGVTQPATSPSATSAVTSFFMEASPGNERYLASVARMGYGRTD